MSGSDEDEQESAQVERELEQRLLRALENTLKALAKLRRGG